MKTQIVVYYFPNYHADRRNALKHGAGWNEWELVRNATPRFPGHRQPRTPLWGYGNEADSAVMKQKIQAAHDAHVSAFIFDWYYYEDGLFLERAVEDGFMPAEDGTKLKFALMWANHDWTNIHPWTSGSPKELLYPGEISDTAFENMTDYIIDKYFRHPAYWLLDGKPYFSIYSPLFTNYSQRLKRFRGKTEKAGFPGLHLNMIVASQQILPGEKNVIEQIVSSDCYDSATSYVWLHHVLMKGLPDEPLFPYAVAREQYDRFESAFRAKYDLPYFPNVSVGWDSSPRTNQNTDFMRGDSYPYTPIIETTPELFEETMQKNLSQHPPIITVNSWNEWTEGSYLEPDSHYGFGFLNAMTRAYEEEFDT